MRSSQTYKALPILTPLKSYSAYMKYIDFEQTNKKNTINYLRHLIRVLKKEKPRKSIIYFIYMCLLFPLQSVGTNLLIEKHWSDYLSTSLIMDEIKWINARNLKFLSLYKPTNTIRPHGGVILLHDRGTHPDWPDVIAPLRRSLPTYGWSTLSIQLPVLSSSATMSDYIALTSDAQDRIMSATEFFNSMGVYNVALIGHGLGAVMGLEFLEKYASAHKIKAFVATGMLTIKASDTFDTMNKLKNIKLPILDIFGSQDLPSVVNDADERKINARFNKSYRQIMISGSDHFFQGQNDELLLRIKSWLKIATPGIELDVNNIELNNN